MKILIADDDKTIHISLTKPLQESGHEVLNAYDGLEALDKVNQEKPDLVFLDISMPGMDGRNVCKAIKENEETKNITVIMLTAKETQFDRQVGFEVGADDYLSKPCSVMYIERAIRKLEQEKGNI